MQTPVPPLLVNLSNHPSACWSDDQKQAALKLAPEIRDLPFPAVPPEADAEAINALADEVVARLMAEAPGATHAMVQGEFTLAHALVRKLQQIGIVCVAATTRWCKAAERRAIVEAARRLALPVGTDLRPEVVRALMAAQMPGGDTPGMRSALRRLDGYLCAHLSELFGRAGVPLAYRGGRGSPLDIRPAFRGALRWYLWLPLSRWLELGRHHPLPRDARTAARRRAAAQYEAAAPLIAARFRRLLAALDRLLREEVR